MRHRAARGGEPEAGTPEAPVEGRGLVVRPATDRDLTAVAGIEARAFTNPWSRRTFGALLHRHDVTFWVAVEPEDQVVGYAVFWSVLDEAELANIAVREDRRERGVGSTLIGRIFEAARKRGVRRIHLEVRASNRVAIDLYLRRGFREVGRRKDYYDSPREDALILTKKLEA